MTGSAERSSSKGRGRLPLLGVGAAALLAGMAFGLARMGALPACATPGVLQHGPLMVCGFLGTVIALERAVASGRGWAYAAPALSALGTVLLFASTPAAGAWCWVLASLAVVAILVGVVRGDPALHHWVLAASALAWLCGNLHAALGAPYFDVVPLWAVFLLGTICAERLELNRLLPRTPLTQLTFLAPFLLLFAGALVGQAFRDVGFRLLGVGALGLGVWLWRFDVARRTVRQKGAVRFIALALLAGYGWLLVGGVLAVVFGNPVAGPRYDAVLHAWFVGFVFSMIFGHALVIVPAVLGVRVDFRPRFYVHLVLLHASLVLRLAGDLGGFARLRQAGGWVNALAILLFIGSTALAARRVRVAARAAQPAAS